MKIKCWVCGNEQETEAQHVAVCGECHAVIRIAKDEPAPEKKQAEGRSRKPWGILPEHCSGGRMTASYRGKI